MPAHNKGAVCGLFLHLKRQVTRLCVQHGSISVEVTYRLLKRTRRNTLKVLRRVEFASNFTLFPNLLVISTADTLHLVSVCS